MAKHSKWENKERLAKHLDVYQFNYLGMSRGSRAVRRSLGNDAKLAHLMLLQACQPGFSARRLTGADIFDCVVHFRVRFDIEADHYVVDVRHIPEEEEFDPETPPTKPMLH